MADVVNLTKRLIGKEDISFDTGGTYASEDFITPSGEHKNLSKINASHIPLVLDTREKFNNANNVDDALKEVGKRIDGFKALDTLAEDIEISFDNDATVNYMQSVINEQKKNLNGHTITFLFPVSLTQNMYSTLEWEDFFNGTIIIHGGTADNRIDLISRLNVMKSIFSIKRCQCEFKIRFFNFQHQNITYAIEAESTTSVIIENCIFYGMTDEYSAAVHNINSNIDFTNCDFSSDEKTDPDLIAAHNTSDIAHAAILKNYLPFTGGTMTGSITFTGYNGVVFPDNCVIRKSGNEGVPELLLATSKTSYSAFTYMTLSHSYFRFGAGDGTSSSILSGSPAGVLTWKGLDITLGYPKYGAGVAVAASTIKSGYTAPSDGWILFKSANGGDASISGVFVGHTDYGSTVFVPVKKGDVAKLNASNTPAAVFFPNR